MFYSVTFAKAVWSQITGKSTAHQKSPFCSQHNSGAVIEQMMRSTAFGKITAVYGQIDENGRFVRKIRVKSRCTAQNKKKSVPSRHEFSSLFSCVRGHDRSATHLVNQAQTNNKAHDKFVPRRDCACADHSRPSLSTALLSGWSSHLVNRVSPHNPLVPSTLARARRAYPSQARLGYAGAERSASHLVNHHLRQPIRPSLRFEHALNQALFAKGW